MPKYTVFCRDSDGTGTTWIQAVEAADQEEAKIVGVNLCASDRGYEPDDDGELNITVIGVAEGEVNVLFWEDI